MKSRSNEVVFDREPIATKLFFSYNEGDVNMNNLNGESAMKYTVKYYTIKPEYLDKFNAKPDLATISEPTLVRYAAILNATLAEMLEMLVPEGPDTPGILDLVRHCIRHHEDFPDVGEISTESAQLMIDNSATLRSIPRLSAGILRDAWNLLVRDEETMTEEE